MEQAGFLTWDTVQLSKNNKLGLSAKDLSPDEIPTFGPNLGFSHWEIGLQRTGKACPAPKSAIVSAWGMQLEVLAETMLMLDAMCTHL